MSYILYVGRCDPIKDIPTLIEAYKKVKTNLVLKIIGKSNNPKYYDYLKSIAPFNTEFIEGISYSELPKIYQESQLLVNPSRTGSIDKSNLEGCACQVPIITCCLSLQTDLDFPKECLFKEGDINELAEKMQKFLSDEEYSIKIGKQLREYIIRKHSLSAFSERLAKVLRGE
jgi:glycosyltransferase involved in cell wall biosynthesis